MKKSEIGRRGEEDAAKYLSEHGYEILHRNYRAGHLETDIICSGEGRTVFVEVKTRTPASKKYGRPSASVDRKKSERLIACAEAYISDMKRSGKTPQGPRIDVIEVYYDGESVKINHIKNAVMKEEQI